MRHYSLSGLLLLGCSVFAQSAIAAGSGHAITGKISTQGAGIEYSHTLSGTIDGRIGIYGGKLDGDFDQDNINYAADLDLNNIAIFADYHPSMGGFRMTAGAFKEDNVYNISAASSELEFEGRTYDGSLSGTIKRDGFSPYLGVGWDSATRKNNGWSLSLDAGVVYQDEMEISLSGTCNSDPITCATFDSEVEKEEAKLRDNEDLKLSPFFAIGISRSF